MQAKILILLVTLILGFGSGFGLKSCQANHAKTVVENQALKDLNQQLQLQAAKQAELIKENQDLQTSLTALDTSFTEDINDQLSENDRLRTDLAVSERMRLKGATCPAGGAAPASEASSLGDESSVLLSGETRQAVLDLRADLLRDRNQILYLQGYVEELHGYLERLSQIE